jgi:type IX secretion system PorP/SprF family membrane protein
MKTLKKIVLMVVLASACFKLKAQQAPMFTHYMYNTLSVNPAYAGSREALTATALHRSQWVNFDGAPVTQTLTIHSPIITDHFGIGLSVGNDKIGPTNNSSAFLSLAYHLKLTERSKLALGLSGGINVFSANLTDIELDDESDPSFQSNIDNRVMPNVGVGAYYYRERFYAGVSVPNLLQNSYSVQDQDASTTLVSKEQRHYFVIAGTVLNLSENLKLKPTTLIKLTDGAPVQTDLTAAFIIRDRLLLGAMFRTSDALGALVGFDINQQLHVGYSFDWSYGVQTFRNNAGSHEVLLRYDFIYSSKKHIQSPRYF